MNRQQRRAAGKSGKPSEKQPDAASALVEAGADHYRSGRFLEAETCCQEALVMHPEFPDALYLMSVIAVETQRPDRAVEVLIALIRQNPKNPEYFLNLGLALQQLDRDDQALAVYDQVLILRSDYADGWHHFARLLEKLKRDDEALLSYDKVLSINPDHVGGLRDRGLLLMEKRIFDEALQHLNRAILLSQNDSRLFQNRGHILQKLNRFDHALEDYNRALEIDPNLSEARNNRAKTLLELRRFDELWACCDQVSTLQPDLAIGHFNEATYRLLVGDFALGWMKREWRWEYSELGLENRVFQEPLWLGQQPIDGKVILIYNDEGLGDALQFCRYIPMLAALGARVIVEVEKPLQALLAQLDGVAMTIAKARVSRPPFDFQCPLTSLPLAFKTRLESIPSTTPYLLPPMSDNDWGVRIRSDAKPKVGIVWSGNVLHKNDHNRSIPLRAWGPILGLDAKFIGLQKQVRTEDADFLRTRTDVLHLGDEFESFSDTAAVIANLDLVISVDTSVAHLAGALGRPVWILLPFTPDWRWLLDRDDSPWYPTARLFRQTETREWPSVMERVRSELRQWIDDRRTSPPASDLSS
jgi:tetratricopeptide (TPR) repeat protein